MKELTDLVKGCETLQLFFYKARAEKYNMLIVPIEKFKIISEKEEFAVVEVSTDGFDESVKPGIYVHPYGSSIGYTISEQKPK